nr:hypothetical protein [Myxococcota bacterium]
VGEPAPFLALPAATIAGDVVELGAVEGASLFLVECGDAASGAIETTLVLDAAPTSSIDGACTTARVRAIDAPGASGSALDLDAVERTVQRFSELTLTP